MQVNVVPQYYLVYVKGPSPNINEGKPCRLCAKPRKDSVLLPIFHNSSDRQLAEKVNKYLPIKISIDDKLPKHICKKCYYVLTKWDNLFISSIIADTKLHSMKFNESSTDIFHHDIENKGWDLPVIQKGYGDVEASSEPLKLSLVRVDNDDHGNNNNSGVCASENTAESTTLNESDKEIMLENNYMDKNTGGRLSPIISEKFLEDITLDIQTKLNFKDITQENLSKARKPPYTQENVSKTRKPPYTCPVCQKTFNRRGTLNLHSTVHSNNRPFKCNDCGASFKRKAHLNGHYQQVHVEMRQKRKSLKINEKLKEQVGEFTCDYDKCEEVFTNKYDLLMHKKTNHSLVCCNICNEMFLSTRSLYRHKVRIHGNSPLICDICGKLFANRFLLHTHRPIHTDEKKFLCEVCGKCFKLNSYLKIHKISHSDVKRVKRHTCCLCSKGFTRLEHLKQHMRIHTGEKPYVCHICNCAFSQLRDRKKHVLTHNRSIAQSGDRNKHLYNSIHWRKTLCLSYL